MRDGVGVGGDWSMKNTYRTEENAGLSRNRTKDTRKQRNGDFSNFSRFSTMFCYQSNPGVGEGALLVGEKGAESISPFHLPFNKNNCRPVEWGGVGLGGVLTAESMGMQFSNYWQRVTLQRGGGSTGKKKGREREDGEAKHWTRTS